MPDHPALLQEFVWQHHDIAPDFPALYDFLDFWGRELEGPLHSVRVAHKKLVGPAQRRRAEGIYRLH